MFTPFYRHNSQDVSQNEEFTQWMLSYVYLFGYLSDNYEIPQIPRHAFLLQVACNNLHSSLKLLCAIFTLFLKSQAFIKVLVVMSPTINLRFLLSSSSRPPLDKNTAFTRFLSHPFCFRDYKKLIHCVTSAQHVYLLQHQCHRGSQRVKVYWLTLMYHIHHG